MLTRQIRELVGPIFEAKAQYFDLLNMRNGHMTMHRTYGDIRILGTAARTCDLPASLKYVKEAACQNEETWGKCIQ